MPNAWFSRQLLAYSLLSGLRYGYHWLSARATQTCTKWRSHRARSSVYMRGYTEWLWSSRTRLGWHLVPRHAALHLSGSKHAYTVRMEDDTRGVDRRYKQRCARLRSGIAVVGVCSGWAWLDEVRILHLSCVQRCVLYMVGTAHAPCHRDVRCGDCTI